MKRLRSFAFVCMLCSTFVFMSGRLYALEYEFDQDRCNVFVGLVVDDEEAGDTIDDCDNSWKCSDACAKNGSRPSCSGQTGAKTEHPSGCGGHNCPGAGHSCTCNQSQPHVRGSCGCEGMIEG